MTVKLASALPKDDKNGLAPLASRLVSRYHSQLQTVAIVVFKTAKLTQDEEFELIPEVRVLRVEAIEGDLETYALDLMNRATETRLGKRPDTLDLSDEPDTEFDDVTAPLALEGEYVESDLTSDAPLALEGEIIDAEIVDEEPAEAAT